MWELTGRGDPARVYGIDTRFLADPACFDRYYRAMSEERRRKVDFYVRERDKRLSLGAGILMGQGLLSYGLKERETAVAYGADGKPYLPEHPGIYFNLSHSGDLAFAVFADVEAGCDIEQVKKADLALAEAFFAPGEYAYLMGQPCGGRDAAFYRLWTLKESFLKAVGTGLFLPLDAFEIVIRPDESVEVRQEVSRASFRFREYRFGEYAAAVCLATGVGADE